MLLLKKDVTAGNPTIEETDLNVTGVIVTGVTTVVASSSVPVVCLQDCVRTISVKKLIKM